MTDLASGAVQLLEGAEELKIEKIQYVVATHINWWGEANKYDNYADAKAMFDSKDGGSYACILYNSKLEKMHRYGMVQDDGGEEARQRIKLLD